MIVLEPPRSAWDLKWRMLGSPVRVYPTFWLMALLICYSAGLPMAYILVSMACIFLSILVHEFGHALCARHFGVRGNEVILYHFGGLCVHEREPPPRWPRLWVLFWGAGAGFVLGGLAFGVLWAANRQYIPLQNPIVLHALRYVFYINLIWGLVNLLPILPLDGGQMVREIVRWKAPRRGERLAVGISFYAALLATGCAAAWCVWEKYQGAAEVDIFPVIFFAVLAYMAWQLRQQIRLYGDSGDGEGPRQPWERDPDWWKQGRGGA
jgi:Zn-dependent protease